MTKHLLAGAAAVVLMSGVALIKPRDQAHAPALTERPAELARLEP
jgi:hypothetical protein